MAPALAARVPAARQARQTRRTVYLPGWRRRIPRPGPWLLRFKQVLAFPLYATVAWLAWVVGTQAGNDAVLMLLGAIPAWPHSRSWGYGPSGGLGLVIVVLVILALSGRL